ncbi:MAG: hypothetical protein NTX11_00205 [Candidatus Saccharibacteria bacterium]|nr:hypothetical protein [Candidatus Saccharibacteria bacterium]
MKNSVSRQKYTTLTNGKTDQATYHDRDSLPFEAVYPLIEFSDDYIEKQTDPKKLEKLLSSNFWYQKANSLQRKEMTERVALVNSNVMIILDFIKQKYGHFDQECVHISIAGSYLYSKNPGDLDLDVVLEGSFFDYSYFSNGIELLDKTNSINKVSLTVMGLDNISGARKIPSEIENEGFLHQDTIIRETLVAPMRNVTVYGRPFLTPDSLDSKNIIARIARQLYFASLTLKGQIPYYKEEPLRSKKVLSRIDEAHDILEWLYMNISDKK